MSKPETSKPEASKSEMMGKRAAKRTMLDKQVLMASEGAVGKTMVTPGSKHDTTFRAFLAFLRRLDDASIHFELRQSREDAIMVMINVPGERWEVEFVDYGDEVHVEVERFKSNGHIDDESALVELFAKYSDVETPAEAAGKTS